MLVKLAGQLGIDVGGPGAMTMALSGSKGLGIKIQISETRIEYGDLGLLWFFA